MHRRTSFWRGPLFASALGISLLCTPTPQAFAAPRILPADALTDSIDSPFGVPLPAELQLTAQALSASQVTEQATPTPQDPAAGEPAPSAIPADPAEAERLDAEAFAALDAVPEDASIEQLMQALSRVSERATARTEELKALEDEVALAQQTVAELEAQVAAASERSLAAEQEVQRTQAAIDQLAMAKYRGADMDPTTAIVGAADPSSAIDRTAFMQAIARYRASLLSQQEAARQQAIQSRDELVVAAEQARERRTNLDEKVQVATAARERLEQYTTQITARVDALREEERLAWENRLGPVAASEIDFEAIRGENPLGVAAVQAALTKLGSPYSWGATGPSAFDCSGLMVWSYAQQGKIIPRTSQAQMAGGMPVPRELLQPGDLIGYYPGATHVGMYIGDGKVVHASDYGIPVQVVALDSMPFYGARRY